MRTGQIGIRRHGRSFIAKAIEWVTYSKTHHVIIAVSETHAISAEPGGVKLHPITHWETLDWSDFHLTTEQRTAITWHALNAQGLPYNFAIFPILLTARLMRRLVPDWISGWLSNRPHVDCSQLCDDIYLAAGIELFGPHNVLTTPGDFERHYIEQGWLTDGESQAYLSQAKLPEAM